MKNVNSRWLYFSLVNIVLVAILGVLMRYKIGFDFPYLDQKHMQNAHSHFAFAGWITHTLYVLMVLCIQKYLPASAIKKYRWLIVFNLLSAYGMLIAFFVQGYGFVSISISQVGILNAYAFAFFFIKDLRTLKQHAFAHWFRAALWFNILSSLGTYSLAYMMVHGHILQSVYLGSVYFYLHFQYNGWFFFASMGLLIGKLSEMNPDMVYNKTAFNLFLVTCIPAYLLSVLWLNLPLWLYILIGMAAFTQFIAWISLWKFLKMNFKLIKSKIAPYNLYIFLLIALSLTIKFSLQLGSVIPQVSELAFGFRPIVIAYLHLVLLAITSLFLLNYLQAFNVLRVTKWTKRALVFFVIVVFLNELTLAIQGISALSYTLVPMVNETLFFISVLMLTALLILLISQWRGKAA